MIKERYFLTLIILLVSLGVYVLGIRPQQIVKYCDGASKEALSDVANQAVSGWLAENKDRRENYQVTIPEGSDPDTVKFIEGQKKADDEFYDKVASLQITDPILAYRAKFGEKAYKQLEEEQKINVYYDCLRTRGIK